MIVGHNNPQSLWILYSGKLFAIRWKMRISNFAEKTFVVSAAPPDVGWPTATYAQWVILVGANFMTSQVRPPEVIIDQRKDGTYTQCLKK